MTKKVIDADTILSRDRPYEILFLLITMIV
jgi:hypothetical protein